MEIILSLAKILAITVIMCYIIYFLLKVAVYCDSFTVTLNIVSERYERHVYSFSTYKKARLFIDKMIERFGNELDIITMTNRDGDELVRIRKRDDEMINLSKKY